MSEIKLKAELLEAVHEVGTLREQKQFVKVVLKGLPNYVGGGKDNRDPQELIPKLERILKSIGTLKKSSRGNSVVSLFNEARWSTEDSTGLKLSEVERFFEEISEKVRKTPKSRKPRKDLKEGEALAAHVACQYLNIFKTPPVTGKTKKGSKQRSSFDRTCDVLEKHLKKGFQRGLIGGTARKVAVKEAKSVSVAEVPR